MDLSPIDVPAPARPLAVPLDLVPGFTLREEIHRGRTRVLYRASRNADGSPVILKTLLEEMPSPRALASLRREYEISKLLDCQGVARALDLVAAGERLALVLQHVPGERLKTLLAARPLPLDAVLLLGIRLASILGEVHRRQIIHKDVNPNNILVDVASLQPTLVDFGIATRLPFERMRLGQPDLLEGTITYMSPEQTGRMNRDLDYRTDFYSLGVTLYEMLTGALPFTGDDPLGVVHAHIARPPRPPAELFPELPEAVSRLVLKLLAKTPEERYQSAEGLGEDLARCRADWVQHGAIAPFDLGSADFTDRFAVPQHLYGRSEEVDTLRAAFERASTGPAELVLVCGYSGIGKTSLIHELHKSLAGCRGYFVSGKFDQLVRNVPYGGVGQAFQGLVRQLLTESEASVFAWRAALRQALGASAQVILDVVPELERLLGPQPPVPALGAAEAQNRFALLFRKFLGVFASPAHPLVLFLDDLQWADAASLQLLQTFLAGCDSHGLLVIGAYRDNEVGEAHPLRLALGELRKAGATVGEIVLGPLALDDLAQLVADTVRGEPARSQPLANLVGRKTDGNPFFVTQFLGTLHQDGLLVFSRQHREWQFDVARIEAAAMTDNVVDLMARKLRKLSTTTQETLQLAACIGNRFDLRTLATVRAGDAARTASELWEALEQGLVVSLGETGTWMMHDAEGSSAPGSVLFKFLHDRVQQAAYALIPAATRQQVHLQIGRLMLANCNESERDERVFDVVNQLNLGAALLEDDAERDEIARLNQRAGARAKASAAYPAALGYFETAENHLGEACWQRDPVRAFALALAKAECQYLCGRFEAAEATFEMLLQRSPSGLDAAEVHRLRVVQFENLSRYEDALEAARAGLQCLGVAMPQSAAEKAAALEAEIRAIQERLGDRPVQGLVDLPPMTDGQVQMCMKVLMAAWASAYIVADRDLLAWIPARMVRLSLEHGNSEESASGYVLHGITLGSRFGDYATGHAFGQLALQLNGKLDDLVSRAKVYEQFACFVSLWRQPIGECIEDLRISHRAGLESGDLTYSTYAAFVESWYGLLTSHELAAFQQEYRPTVAFLERIRYAGFAAAERLILHWGLALQGLTRGATSLSSDDFDEDSYLQTWVMPFFRVFYFIPKLHLLFTMEDYAGAATAAREARTVVDSLGGTIWPMLLEYYEALLFAAVEPGSAAERQAKLEKLGVSEAKLRLWAENCPRNFRSQHLQVAAEKARLEGRQGAAMELYEAAIDAAKTSGLPHQMAVAYELYGKFWLLRGQEKLAAVCLTAAQHAYERWGARAKTRQLASRYGALVRPPLPAPEALARRPTTLATTEAGLITLDLASVMKAAQAIAGEIELEPLLRSLMRLLIENAGARKGLLLLSKDGEWQVQAEGALESGEVRVLAGPSPEETPLAQAVVNFVRRTGESVVLDDATQHPDYKNDAHVRRQRCLAVLCTPVRHQGQLIGAVYLENDLVPGAFTAERIEMIQMLSAHAAIAIRNAELFTEVSRLRDRLQAENVYLQEEIRSQQGFDDIVGRGGALQDVLQRVAQVAPTDTTVLITGETGTGKELVARAIHQRSARRDSALITLDCGAISAGLVESELFGHEKGAFTGALARKIGRFELAHGGTIFLDEIGDLQPDLQVKLLRVLQEGEIQRLGDTRTIKVDVRVIAATHQRLEQAVREGRFRSDLYYRLNVFPITIPPLRERKEDIPLLVSRFVLQFGGKLGKRIDTIPKDTLDTLLAYSWPGNVRELRNVIERSLIVSTGNVLALDDRVLGRPLEVPAAAAAASPPAAPRRAAARVDDDRQSILEALSRTGWRVSGPQGAAVLLGLRPTTLEARMKKLGISRPGTKTKPT